jgi:hypothetical protein
MKFFALLVILFAVAFSFDIENRATAVSKTEGLKWNCQTCANTCSYGGFPNYCADAYYCVCSYQTQCTASVKNIC